MKKFILPMLLTVFLVSCDLLDLFDLEGEEFYAQNFRTDTAYTIRAKILAEGNHCVIWAENGSGVSEKKAKEIAAEYDANIRPKIVGEFGMKNITAEGRKFNDILDYANWLAGKEDKKLTILLLDIKDNFNGTTNNSFVAGYFYSGNFYKKNQVNTSNERDMIYVDTYPALSPKYQLEQRTYSTFAHELQHLINFTTTLLVERKNSNGRGSPMDTWIDEGLSSQAEQIYSGENIKEQITQFNKSETIAKGNNFFVWGEKPEAILDEYATVYLFFRWLSLHAEAKGLQSNFFLDIITSKNSDYSVITHVANRLNPGKWDNWEKLLSDWLAANYYPDNSDYGYKDSYFYTGDNKIAIKTLTTTSTPLYPGEGVYSIIKGSYNTPSSSGNIRYATLDKGAEKALLTYNANTNNKSAWETGTLTGVAASVSSPGFQIADSQTADSQSRMVIEDEQTYTGPYAIDPRDISVIFGRNK